MREGKSVTPKCTCNNKRKISAVSSSPSGLLFPLLIHNPPVAPRAIEKFDHFVVGNESERILQSKSWNSDPKGIEPLNNHGWNPWKINLRENPSTPKGVELLYRRFLE
ncbi:hypothetical protein P872_20540 [Rhodonellum psychrophilum GCM71 = DSM 17998]|uniref:Uncharacterized protein n=2 Tax=Rhodonellum TaxID=336827 RepID=U5BUF7_9BACT|nr:hypothetical protein P872_20540 [Rhodonellum psychrophilum GCM71 = DSM 17998]SDZ20819.1 hypothetical protein SAMN05444412_107200 [Rhodonellum ikkaensis]